MSFQDLYTGTQSTSAFGYPPPMAVTQGGNWDPQLNALVQLATSLNSAGEVADARDWAFGRDKDAGLRPWKKSEATAVHAEVLIIRGWLVQEILVNRRSLSDAIKALQGRTIRASQPACWCCARLMADWGIVHDSRTIGNKPRTGWRHPLATAGVPNSDIPDDRDEVTTDWIQRTASR